MEKSVCKFRREKEKVAACGDNVQREGFSDDSGSSARPSASVCDMCKSAALPRLQGPDWDGKKGPCGDRVATRLEICF